MSGSLILDIENGVDTGGPVVIILATGTEVRGFKPGRGKNPEYDFLRKGSKALVPCRRFTALKITST